MSYAQKIMEINSYSDLAIDHAAVVAEQADAEIAWLRAMVKDAYNAGFSEGMKEHRSFKGGAPWSESKFILMLNQVPTVGKGD